MGISDPSYREIIRTYRRTVCDLIKQSAKISVLKVVSEMSVKAKGMWLQFWSYEPESWSRKKLTNTNYRGLGLPRPKRCWFPKWGRLLRKPHEWAHLKSSRAHIVIASGTVTTTDIYLVLTVCQTLCQVLQMHHLTQLLMTYANEGGISNFYLQARKLRFINLPKYRKISLTLKFNVLTTT